MMYLRLYKCPFMGGLLGIISGTLLSVTECYLSFSYISEVSCISLLLLIFFRKKFLQRILSEAVEVKGRPDRILSVYYYIICLTVFNLTISGLIGAFHFTGPLQIAPHIAVVSLIAVAVARLPPSLYQTLLMAAEGQVIHGRDKIWTLLSRLSEVLNSENRVLVTSLEDVPTDYIDESEPSRLFMLQWIKKVQQGVKVQQVIRVFDHKEDIVNLTDRVSRYANLPGVELGVILSPAPEPILDVYIIEGEYAIISYSTSAAAPSMITSSIFTTNANVVGSLTSFFKETLWSKAEPLKTSFQVNQLVLDDLARANVAVRELGNRRLWREIPALVARGGSIARDILELFGALRQSSPMMGFRADDHVVLDIRRRLKEVTAAIRATPQRSLIEFPSVFHAVRHFDPSEKIQAVSLFDNELYWHSPSGQLHMNLEKELAEQGVAICRIFVVPSVQRLSMELNEIATRQRSYAGDENILIVERSLLQATLPSGNLVDFAVVDQRAAVNDGGHTILGYTDVDMVAQSIEAFKLIYEKALNHTILQREITMSMSAELDCTIVCVDMVGYSTVARILEESLSSSQVEALNSEIQRLINDALEQIGIMRSETLIAATGDGAILKFDTAEAAHLFAFALIEKAEQLNSSRTEQFAKRAFRVGAASGRISVKRIADGPLEAAGITIANAVRLETAGKYGDLLVDATTFSKLPTAYQSLYGPEVAIAGKRNESFIARRCVIHKNTVSISLPLEDTSNSNITKSTDRRAVYDILSKLPSDKFSILLYLLEVPLDAQPSPLLSLGERKATFLAWITSTCEIDRLRDELHYLLANH